uniref:Spaetzle domain-containing protein n=1 Tax=Photinus pyralis TaxID=7054 RepID=A0A1Y1KKQ0_PHOPY
MLNDQTIIQKENLQIKTYCDVVMKFVLLLIVSNLATMVRCIDDLPCTASPDANTLRDAINALTVCKPAGYDLVNATPKIGVGKVPHRWEANFRCTHPGHEYNERQLPSIKLDFKRRKPNNVNVSRVEIVYDANLQPMYRVEYLTYCGCARAKRSVRQVCSDSDVYDCTFINVMAHLNSIVDDHPQLERPRRVRPKIAH